MFVEFVGQSARDDDFRANASSRLLNFYRQPSADGMVLKSVLGTEAFTDVLGEGVSVEVQDESGNILLDESGNSLFASATGASPGAYVLMRDMIEDGGLIYMIIGDTLFQVSAEGETTELASVLDDEAVLSSNNGAITIASGGTYYVWNGATLETPTGGRFTDVGSVAFLGEYTIRTQNNGREFDWSELTDPETLNGLYFATAEKRDDNILRAVAINGRLVLFKETSREVWSVTGQAGANAFRFQGVIDTGLKAKNLVAEIDQGAFFVGDDDIVYITNGLEQKPISTPPVSTSIAQSDPTRCFYYEDEGHKFCVIRFSDRPAWVYDLTTLEWHERQEDNGAWSAQAAVKLGANWYVGTDLGYVHKLSRNNADVDFPLVRKAVSKTLRQPRKSRVRDIEVFPLVGESDLGRDATCWMRTSRDGGLTWGEIKSRSVGDLGDYEKRVQWRGSQGQFTRFTMELSMSDPVELPLKAVAGVEVS